MVAHFELSDGEDLVIKIAIAGKIAYYDKAKYGQEVGINRCKNGFAVQTVNLRSSSR
jgi:hypothetical protein